MLIYYLWNLINWIPIINSFCVLEYNGSYSQEDSPSILSIRIPHMEFKWYLMYNNIKIQFSVILFRLNINVGSRLPRPSWRHYRVILRGVAGDSSLGNTLYYVNDLSLLRHNNTLHNSSPFAQFLYTLTSFSVFFLFTFLLITLSKFSAIFSPPLF